MPKTYVFYVSMCLKKTSYNVIKKRKTYVFYVFSKKDLMKWIINLWL